MQKEVHTITDNWRFAMKTDFSICDSLLSVVHNQTMNCIRKQLF